MKKFLMLSLIGLFGLCCLISTDTFAHVWKNGEFAHPGQSDGREGYGKTLGFVYGRVGTVVSWKRPTITCLHSGYICNYSGGLEEWPDKLTWLRWYFKPKSTVTGPSFPNGVTVKDGNDEGWLDSYWMENPHNPVYGWEDYYHHTFPLRGHERGIYTVVAETIVEGKYDINEDGDREDDGEQEEWKSSVTDTFEFK